MIHFENISKTFHSGEAMEIKAVVNINLQINSGDFIVVVGANGSGKSTLLNLIAGTFHPDQGNLFFDKKIVNQQQEYQRAKSIARLFQNPLSGTAPELSIIENFRLAALRTSAKKISIGINQEFRKRVSDRIQLLGMGLENEGVELLASRCRGTPRIANRVLRRCRDVAQVKGQKTIDAHIATKTLDMLGIDTHGLDEMDRAILRTIIVKFDGGPVGLSTLGASLGEETETLEEVYEPFLIQCGLLKRTPRGRMATSGAYRLLGIIPPQANSNQASLF